MKITNPKNETIKVYEEFKKMSGSNHIAKPTTIDVVIDICRQIKPINVLELGGGLGTVSYTILKYSNATIDIYEHDEFCRQELDKNLKDYKGRFNIINSYNILPPKKSYDFIMVDGGSGKVEHDGINGSAIYDGGTFDTIYKFIKSFDSVKIIYIEGHRHFQRIMARKALKDNYIYNLTRYQDVEFNGEKLNGGLKITCHKSNFKALRRI